MSPEPDQKKGKTGRLIYRIVLIVLLSVFLGSTVYTLNARRVMHNELPMPFGVGASVVLSGSMEPTLSVNDLVYIRAVDDYAVGDVVVYQSGRSLVIHRIVRIEEEYAVTQGDANNTEDDPVALTAIKGRMVFAIPFVGILVRFLQSVPGAVLVIALIALLMTLSRRRERTEDNKKIDEIKEEIRRLKQLEENKEIK